MAFSICKCIVWSVLGLLHFWLLLISPVHSCCIAVTVDFDNLNGLGMFPFSLVISLRMACFTGINTYHFETQQQHTPNVDATPWINTRLSAWTNGCKYPQIIVDSVYFIFILSFHMCWSTELKQQKLSHKNHTLYWSCPFLWKNTHCNGLSLVRLPHLVTNFSKLLYKMFTFLNV